MIKKNLIIIHLESLSNTIYQNNRVLFPNLNSFSNKCIKYDNYYTTATSTLMAMSDFFYGDLIQYESCTNLAEEPKKYIHKETLFDVLKNNNYKTMGVGYPLCDKSLWPIIEKKHVFGFRNSMTKCNNYNDFINTINKFCCTESNPFALFVFDGTSHISYNDFRKHKGKNSTDKWKYGYKAIDETVGNIIRILNEKQLLDQTTILMYGDHGDDFWEHSLHDGYCHGIEPYTNISNTPLFLYSPDFSSCNCSDVISTIDLKDMILQLLNLNCKDATRMIYDGYRSRRKYALSRNLYANQFHRVITLNKSYSLTNGRYNLIVSKKGLELYNINFDSSNHNNLLDFFQLKNNNDLVYINRLSKLKSEHYKKFMTPQQIKEIQINFKELKECLFKDLKLIYKDS